jgi:hypothetical protein
MNRTHRRDLKGAVAMISLDEIARAAVAIVRDESPAGRVVVYGWGQQPALIRWGDPGYAELEPYRT